MTLPGKLVTGDAGLLCQSAVDAIPEGGGGYLGVVNHGSTRARWGMVDRLHRGDPGVNTHGRTLEQARENLREAAQLMIEANREQARREAGGKDATGEEFRIVV